MNFFTHAERHTEIQNRLSFSIVRSQRARPLGDKGNVADMTLTYGERPIWPEVIFKFHAALFFRLHGPLSRGHHRPANLTHRPVARVRRAVLAAIKNNPQVQRIPMLARE